MSYNVRHGYSMNWEPAIYEQARIINQQKPDWVGLQEIDNQCRRSGFINQAKRYGELTDLEPKFAKFMDFDSGEYGMAVLSGCKTKLTKIIELPEGAEPRVSLMQIIQPVNNVELLIANVHFDWTDSDIRVKQAEALLSVLNQYDLPMIILGDFNARPDSPTLKKFQSAGFQQMQKDKFSFTWNAKNPTVQIDHMVYKNSSHYKIIPQTITVLKEPSASDHRPVVAEINLLKQ